MRFYSDAKKILHLTMPLLSSRLMNLVVFFGGFVMVAKLGENEFAASALANSIFITIILIGVGILYAVGIKMSHAYGAEDHEKIREYLYSGTLLSILLSVLAVAFVLALSFLLPYLGQKPELIPYAKTFMYSMCLPILPAMLSVVANQLVTALLKPRIIFASSVINVPISLFALYAFIFGRFGFPKLGIWGFGWAIAIGDIFLVVVPVLFVMTSRYFKTFNLWHLENLRHYLWKRMMEIVKLGVPMGVQFGAEVAAFAVITFFVGRFGVSALSAFQIAQQIIVVALMIPLTTSEATAILVGQALGRKDPDSMRSIGFSSIILVVLFLLIASIIFYIFPRLLISIYIDVKNPALASIVSLGTLFLYFSAFTQLFDGI
ncbi:MAG: hypothetical protein KDH94_06170, partial [Coxiellaceae bacterium]|nr:hypothetical protein [Coxiellaceae bacterium]